jgi:hypothetical protein
MKANELRIGNIIGDTLLNTVVVTIDVLKTIDDHTSPIGEDGVYKPMPLTEEWLLKFGFKKQKGYVNELSYSDFGVFRIYWPTEAYLVSLHFKPNETEWYPFLREGIKYVHQLQNIIYALTGKELTL